ncbi:MAG: hypothetical protein R2784_05540 [Saprospiraceae bacterium]
MVDTDGITAGTTCLIIDNENYIIPHNGSPIFKESEGLLRFPDWRFSDENYNLQHCRHT